jgi:hypothetical protein
MQALRSDIVPNLIVVASHMSSVIDSKYKHIMGYRSNEPWRAKRLPLEGEIIFSHHFIYRFLPVILPWSCMSFKSYSTAMYMETIIFALHSLV